MNSTIARSTLKQWQARYENFLRATGRGRETISRIAHQLDRVIQFFPQKRYPNEFSRLDIEDLKAAMEKQGRLKQSLRELQSFKAFWNWMIEHGAEQVPHYNPVGSLPQVKSGERGPRYLTTQEVSALNAEGPLFTRCRAAWVMLNTGKRCSELPGLTWGELLKMTEGVPMGVELEDSPFRHRTGALLKVETLELQIRRLFKKCGIKKTPEALRYTWAIEQLRAGKDLEFIKQRMGLKELNF